MKFRLTLLFSVLMFINTAQGTGFSPVLNTSFGMFDLGLTENSSTLSSTDTTVVVEDSVATATNVAATSFEVNYEFVTYAKKSFFGRAIVPLVSPDGSGIFMGSIGANFYLNSMATVFSYNEKGTSITISPKFRYYWGGSTGIGYVIYNTVSAKKSDVFFDLGLHGGAVYNWKKGWGIRGEVGASRGTGVATSSFGIRYFVGAAYYFGIN